MRDCHGKTRQAVSISSDGSVAESMNLVKQKCRLDVRRNFFSCRVVDQWNSLPLNVQRAVDVQVFKEKYDEFVA